MSSEEKSEEMPRKSSSEILSELFGAFNAQPPPVVTSCENYDDSNKDWLLDNLNIIKPLIKNKKLKKKLKKAKRQNALDSDDDKSSRKKKKHKKKKKKKSKKKTKHKKNKKCEEDEEESMEESSDEDSTSTSDISLLSPLENKEKTTQFALPIPEIQLPPPQDSQRNPNNKISVISLADIEMPSCKTTSVSNNDEINKTEKGDAGASVDECFEKLSTNGKEILPDKRKMNLGSKIMIKNLKNSSVFEATVKQVEEQARLKAEKYEEGELSEGSATSSSSISDKDEKLSPFSQRLKPNSAVGDAIRDQIDYHSEEDIASTSDKLIHKSEGKIGICSKHGSKNRSPLTDRLKKKKARSRSRSRSRSKEKYKKRKKEVSESKKSSNHRHNEKRARHHHSESRRSLRGQTSHHHRHSSPSKSRSYVSHRRSPVFKKSRKSSSRSRSRSRNRSRSRSRIRSRSRSRNKYSKEKRKEEGVEKIDKQRLLEIARKNALSMLKQSTNLMTSGTPNNIAGAIVPSGVEQTKVMIAAGGKTVDELTDFCKLLSKKEAEGHESISSNSSHESSDTESEKPFHHPFQIKDRPQAIVMNIRNSVAVPLKTFQEKTAEQSKALRLQFPVSSGQLHRKNETDWVPVSPKKESDLQVATIQHIGFEHQPSEANLDSPLSKTTQGTQPNTDSIPALNPPPFPNFILPGQNVMPSLEHAISYPPVDIQSSYLSQNVISEPPQPVVDITSAVAHRLSAMKRLQQNPNDAQALKEMNKAQQQAQAWVQSKFEPGQFTGSTGARVLTQAELASGTQAWARRDQLTTAAPVQSGMGMALLQKMGWRPGEGLGKNKEGSLEPLKLQVKMDKKGLVAQDEVPHHHMVSSGQKTSIRTNFEGKHPVSLLNELCSRKRYGPPIFDCIFETGPDHKKNFIFKVKVNGMEYKPGEASQNKKQAKIEAATLCLKSLGLLRS